MGGQQVHRGQHLSLQREGESAKHLPLGDRSVHRTLQVQRPLQRGGISALGQQQLHIRRRMDGHMVHLGQRHADLLHQLSLLQHRLIGEVLKTPVEETGGLGKALDLGAAAGQGHGFGPQHHADEGEAALRGSGYQAVAGIGGGAGLDAVGPAVQISQGPPVGDQVVGGVEHPLLAEIGGGDGGALHIADPQEVVMLQGLRCDEVQVPGGGVVLAVMQAGGVDEVGVLTPQSRSLFIHGAHEGVHAAADLLRQNVARLVGGDDQHTLQQLFHRQHLPGPDAGGAAIRRQPLQGALRNSDWLVHGQLPAVHCLQRQQSGHDLGEAGGIELLVLVLSIDHAAGVGVHQQGSLGLDGGVRHLCGGGRTCQQGDRQDQQQKNREKAVCFHIKLLPSVV